MPSLLDITELGNPILRIKTKDVTDIHSDEVQSLIDNMLLTVKEAPGVGIAAPQVGSDLSIFIVSPDGEQRYPHCSIEDTLVVINPKITGIGEETHAGWEGCLSIPGLTGIVNRFESVKVEYITRLGESRTDTFDGFTARIFQHEYDHLKGVLFLDRIRSVDNLMTNAEFNRMVEAEENEEELE